MEIGGHESQHCGLTSSLYVLGPTDGTDFNQIGGHESQHIVLRCFIQVHIAYRWIRFQN